jgi:signal transduction histidine kinase
MADQDALHQIVINLLDNAVKYGGSGPITLRAARHDGRARVEVEDTGPGVPESDRERIWQPFVRLRSADRVPGSGIGLAVVRELVLAHGGACRVEHGPAGGSRFVVELPHASVVLPASDRATGPLEAPWPAS